MSIGRTIKRLRFEQGITQEKLAERLGITANAISQWECGRTLPDISILPLLCECFSVSADVLLEIDITQFQKKEQLQMFLSTCSRLHSEGKTAERIRICRAYQEKYPNEEIVLYQLMKALKTENECVEEIISIGKHLLSSQNNEYRYGAIRTLCLTYCEMGNREKAAEYAHMMPTYDDLLLHVLEGEELVQHCQIFFYNMCEQAELHLHCLLNAKDNKYTPVEKHRLQEDIIHLFYSVFPDGDFGFYHERLGRLYFKTAISSAESGNDEVALEELEKMCRHFEKSVEVEAIKHSSPLVNRLLFTKEQRKRHDAISVGKRFLRYLDMAFGKYQNIIESPRYLSVVEKLNSI